MKYIHLICCMIGLSFPFLTQAQPLKTFHLEDTSSTIEISGTLYETSPDDYTLIGSGRFSFDSSYLHLIDLNSEFEAGNYSSFRMSGLAIFNDSEPATDGYYLAGSNFGSVISFPFLIKTDSTMAVEWSVTFDSLAISQTHIRKVFSDGENFTAFSYSSPGNKVVHRIKGDSDGANLAAYSIENPDNRFRFYDGIRSGSPNTHIMGGTIENDTTNETDAFIAAWDDSGMKWNKFIDFGASGTEEFRLMTPQQNGEFLATVGNFNVDSSRSETFLCKMDTSGAISWVKKITLSTGHLNMGYVSYTPSGNILMAGLINNLEAAFMELSPQGDFISSKKWIWPNEYWSGIQSTLWTQEGNLLMQLGNMGEIYFAELDSTGVGCNFETGPAIDIVDFTAYTEASITVSNTPFVITSSPMPLSNRELNLATTEYCVNMTTGIHELESDRFSLNLFPQPAGDFLHIETDLLHPNTRIQVINVMGQIEIDKAFESTISIQQLPAGWYGLRIIADGKMVVKGFVKR